MKKNEVRDIERYLRRACGDIQNTITNDTSATDSEDTPVMFRIIIPFIDRINGEKTIFDNLKKILEKSGFEWADSDSILVDSTMRQFDLYLDVLLLEFTIRQY